LTKLTYIFSVSNFGNAFPTLCLLTTKCFHPNFLSHSPWVLHILCKHF